MLLKDVSKMIDCKFNEEFDLMEISEMTKFSITAIDCGNEGYILGVLCNDKCIGVVSSKRSDKRVFKTLDAIKRALMGVGIHGFEVIGLK